MKNKKMKLENEKMEKMERLKRDDAMTEYLQSYEYELELQIENKELLQDVISDVLKF